MTISSFKTIEGSPDIDLNASPGTTFALTPASAVTIIDPFEEYVDLLKSCFDFEAMKEFAKRPEFSILFDGMHGAGGPFARRILVGELGFPEVRHSTMHRIFRLHTCACFDPWHFGCVFLPPHRGP